MRHPRHQAGTPQQEGQVVMDAQAPMETDTPVVTDAPAPPPSAEAKDTPPKAPPETDWKAQYETERAKRVSAEAAAAAEAGRARKAQAEKDQETARVEQFQSEIDAILEGKVTDKPSADAFRAQKQTDEWAKTREAGVKAEIARVWAAAKEFGVDPNADKAFQRAGLHLAKARKAATEEDFDLAMLDAQELADAAIATIRERAAAAAKPPAAPSEKPKGVSPEEVERTRRFETVGAGTAAGGMSDEARWSAFGRGELAWSKEVRDAGKRLGLTE